MPALAFWRDARGLAGAVHRPERHPWSKQFRLKKDADAWSVRLRQQTAEGTPIPKSTSPDRVHDTTLRDDLLTGVAAIADYTGLPKRRIWHLIEVHGLPVFRRGRSIYARKHKIDAYFDG